MVMLCNAGCVSGSSDQLLVSCVCSQCSSLSVLFFQHENRESTRRDTEPQPTSDQSHKFVRLICKIFV